MAKFPPPAPIYIYGSCPPLCMCVGGGCVGGDPHNKGKGRTPMQTIVTQGDTHVVYGNITDNATGHNSLEQ